MKNKLNWSILVFFSLVFVMDLYFLLFDFQGWSGLDYMTLISLVLSAMLVLNSVYNLVNYDNIANNP